jgi:putative flippase GtrA
MKPWLQNITKTRPLRYIFVGASTFVLDIVCLYLFHRTLGLEIAWSTSLAFGIALIYNFSLTRFWAFDKHTLAELNKHAVLYGLLVGANYVITVAFVSFAGRVVYFLVAKTIIAILQVAWNYPIYKYIIFKHE